MTWDKCYDKLFEWSEEITQIKKFSLVENIGPADEVAEVMLEFVFDHEDTVNRETTRC